VVSLYPVTPPQGSTGQCQERQIQCIPMKIPLTFFTEIKKHNPKIYMEPEMTLNNRNNLEKEEQSRRHHTS
jgi:hypothetical protein